MTKTFLAFCIPAALGIGLLIGAQAPLLEPEEPTYALIITNHDGNEYVVDYDLTDQDCTQALSSWVEFGLDAKGVACEKEPK